MSRSVQLPPRVPFPASSVSTSAVIVLAVAATLLGLGGPVGVTPSHAATPEIDTIQPATAPTSGGTTITLRGRNFGRLQAAGSVQVGNTPAEVLSWADSSVVYANPEGNPGPIDVVLVEGSTGLASAPAPFAYAPPVLLSLSPTSVGAGGGVRLTIVGENFGRADGPRDWSVAGTPAEETAWLGHDGAEVEVPALGTSGPVELRLVANGIAAPPLVLDVRAVPGIVSVSPQDTPTRGGTTITIEGSGFGTQVGTTTIDGSVAAVQSWSDQRIVASTPESGPGPRPLAVTTSAGDRSDPVSYDYGLPSIDTVTPSSAPTTGGTIITINGSNFGSARSERSWSFGDTRATEVLEVTHTRALVVLPERPAADGPGTVSVSAVVDGFAAASGATFEYLPAPRILATEPTSAPTAGGTRLTIHGADFGLTAGTVELCGDAPVVDWTPTAIVVDTPACDPGPASLRVTTAGPDPLVASSSFSFDLPVITEVSSTGLPAVGGTRLTIRGENFGRAVPATPRVVDVDGALAPEVEWRGHGEVVVEAPAVLPGRDLPVCLRVGPTDPGCGTVASDPVEITGVTPASGPVAGGIRITIEGRNFGTRADTPRTVQLGTTPAPDVTFVADDRLLATTPEGASAGAVDLGVDVAGASATLPAAFTYESTVSVDAAPSRFALYPNQPNPFSSNTTIALDLPRQVHTSLVVYDLRGREVHRFQREAGPGRLLIGWDGTDPTGAPLASGVYFYRVEAGDFRATSRVLLVR